MSTPVFKILFGTAIVGEARPPEELGTLLGELMREFIAMGTVAELSRISGQFHEKMSKRVPQFPLLGKLTVPTESYELFCMWKKLHKDSAFALVYSEENPHDCFVIDGEAVIQFADKDGNPNTYEELKEFYTGPGAGTQSQSVN